MSEPKRQHYVPQCYLREWIDPNVPKGHEPFVWIFDRKGKNKKRKAPKNILRSNDLYTLQIKGRQKNYSIEKTLSSLEGEYAKIFREKIRNRLPLSEKEHVLLCSFVSVMLQRTLRQKDNLERFYDELVKVTESMEKHHNIEPKKSIELRDSKKDAHKVGIVEHLPDFTEILFRMGLAFLCADESSSKFLTSDDPCTLFNPDLQWQRFYGPGLLQRNIQVTLPLSPNVMVCLSWSNLRGYIKWSRRRVDESNRMTIGHSYEYVVCHSSRTKRLWFRKYPMNLIFLLRILIHQVRMFKHRIAMGSRFRNVRNK